MSAKHLIGSLFLLAPLAASAQEAPKTETTGTFSVEGRKVEVDPKSAKYNEYQDTNNQFPIYKLGVSVVGAKGHFFDLDAVNLLRDDQTIRASTGRYGLWSIVAERNGIPHNLSFKAMTPFRDRGQGVLALDSTSPIPNRALTGTAAQLLANDAATGSWLLSQLRPVALGTQRDRTSATLTLTPTERLKFRMVFTDDRKEGTKIGTGVIGDRPPRSLAAQLAQPVDYQSRELKFEAEYNKPWYQAMATVTVSRFENAIDAMRWQNPYATFNGSNTFDQWNYRVATFGQMPLAPDNTSRNASFVLGVNLPWSGRLNLTASKGSMKQDVALLPYSTSNFNSTTTDFAAPSSLPRPNAAADLAITRYQADYTVQPLSRLNLRAYVRAYDMDNRTPQGNWWYITSDTMPGGSTTVVTTPTYKNQRRNLAYAFKETATGLEATTYARFWRTSFGLVVEKEQIDRTFREGSTDELIVKGTLRMRPSEWLSLRAKVLTGNRDGGAYDYAVSTQTYWYDMAGRDTDNPRAAFTNHPDMRKYDVSDRKRTEMEASAVLTPAEALSVAFTFSDRKKDYDSQVASVQPLLNNPYAPTDADRAARTPGQQLGLLENNSRRYAVDVTYAPEESWSVNLFASRDRIDLLQRGLEFNENNRLNPTLASLATNDLGPWTRASSQWMSRHEDETTTYGFGAQVDLLPGKLNLAADFSHSSGTVDIRHSGFGVVRAVDPTSTLPDNHEYGFRTPPTVRNKQTTLNAHLKYKATRDLAVGLHYSYDNYDLKDWMQEANTPWFESVGSEFFLRDTSSATSTQWGNRLINLGSYLAPTYNAHYVSLSVHYRF